MLLVGLMLLVVGAGEVEVAVEVEVTVEVEGPVEVEDVDVAVVPTQNRDSGSCTFHPRILV